MNNNIILFENYLLGHMSKNDCAMFEQRLRQDEALTEEFEEFRLVVKAFRKSERKELLNQMILLEKQVVQDLDMLPSEEFVVAGVEKAERKRLLLEMRELDTNEKTTRKSIPNVRVLWRAVAASVAIVMIAGAGWFLNNRQQTNQLFDNHFSNYDHSFIKRSSDNDALVSKAYTLYDNNEYRKAISVLEQLNDSPLHRLYLGIAYLGNKQSTEAMHIFEELSSSLPSHQNVIHWYSALAELQQGDTTDMISKLDLINYDEHWIAKKEALLATVKK